MAASSGATTSGSGGLPPSGGGGGRAGGLLDLGNLLGDLGDSSTSGGLSASSTFTQQPQKQWNAGGGWATSASAFGQPAGMASSAKPSGGNLLDLSDLLGGSPGDGGGDGASLSSVPDPHPRGAVTLDLRLNPLVG